GLRVPVVGGTAFDDIRDVHVLAAKPHPLGDDLGQELPGPADEGLAPEVLVPSRRLADEHEPRPRIPDPEDEMRAMRSELATPAVAEVRDELVERARLAEAGAREQVGGPLRRRGGTHGWGGRCRRGRKAELTELALVVDPRPQRRRQFCNLCLRGHDLHYTIAA